MNECKEGNLFGMNIKTNIALPSHFPFHVDQRFGEKKIISYHTDSLNRNIAVDYNMYSTNEKNNVLYKKNEKFNSYIIETDRIGVAVIDKENIMYNPPSITAMNPENNAFLLSFGLGIAMLLRLNDYIVLHASALKLQNKTVLIMGQSGVGKTTLCSYLIKEYSALLISDDMSCINTDNCKLYAGFPLMRLWPQTVKSIFDVDSSKLDKVGKNGKTYFPVQNFTKSFIHNIDAIVILRQTDNAPSFLWLETMNLMCILFKHIYNRQSLDATALNKEMAGICKVINLNNTKGFVFNNPRTYESLNRLSTMLINCL